MVNYYFKNQNILQLLEADTLEEAVGEVKWTWANTGVATIIEEHYTVTETVSISVDTDWCKD